MSTQVTFAAANVLALAFNCLSHVPLLQVAGWRAEALLNPSVVLFLHYEDLMADQPGSIRRLVRPYSCNPCGEPLLQL